MHIERTDPAVWTLLDPPTVRLLESSVFLVCAAFALVGCGDGGGDDGGATNDSARLDNAQATASGAGTPGSDSRSGNMPKGLVASEVPVGGSSSDGEGSSGTPSPPTPPAPPGGPGGPGCGGSALQPAEAAMVSGYIDTLPYKPANDAKRAQIIDTILKTCEVFAPPSSSGFAKKHCYAHLAAAIHKESTYNLASSVTDAYATRAIGAAKANDPTVGLLQIRFSSTVHDFVKHGPLDKLACVGCMLPADLASHVNESGDSTFWAVQGPSANMTMMTSAACNVPLGAWYYYVNATGNGNPASATYIYDYCQGKGTAANLITGLRSHLNGPSGGRGIVTDINALQSTDYGSYQYVSTIKSWFDGMLGPIAGKHPFFFTLPPAKETYCR